MVTIQRFTFNFFAENTYVLSDESGECIIIDPGCHTADEQAMLKKYIESNNLKPVRLLNTHCHIDHVMGNKYVAELYGLGLECHRLELSTLQSNPYYAQAMFGVRLEPSPQPLKLLEEGDIITFGNTQLDILFAPGHSAGSVCFYSKAEKFAIVGDVIFNRSIGRTDLPGGNYEQLIASIKNKIYTLPDNTVLYPGHMEPTMVGEEMQFNPFVRSSLE